MTDKTPKNLSELQKQALFEAGTEMPYSGALLDNKETGEYMCAACGQVIFDSDTKYDSGSGWPSFYDAREGAVTTKKDTSFGMIRDALQCSSCGGHLGHVFPDGPPQTTGLRYCVNSTSLNFMDKSGATIRGDTGERTADDLKD